MNKTTQERYERIGAILNQIALQTKISPLERLLIEELNQSDKAFQQSLNLLRLLKSTGDVLTIVEIAARLGVHEETATAMTRSLSYGGFEFEQAQQNLDTGGRVILLGLRKKESALTYLLESLT
jgi:DNA-binding MarR family transcriptional regulator